MVLFVLAVCFLIGLSQASPSKRFRRTPFGVFDASCVHKAKSGSHIFTRNGTVFVSHPEEAKVRAIPKCVANSKRQNFPASYDGWLAYTSYKTTYPTFDNFLGMFGRVSVR